ncbi:MAG TPA: arylsulfatase [Candidatus Krumholzibacteria bacterium]|nr:arylsulfatase [Candidatus Krumholzibacteria bacterium]
MRDRARHRPVGFLFRLLTVLCVLLAVAGCGKSKEEAPAPAGVAGGLDRRVLPIAEPTPPTITEVDARKATAPERFEVKAPEKAPNVVIVLIDDTGFGHSQAFGGPISTPTLETLANNGLRYNRFHTTALCSPTRTALLTGRNHHINNAGAIMELATAFPGNTGVRPNSVAPLAEILRLNGYSTAAFGKYHETAPWEASVSGPYDRWPTRSGFDKFYGFIGGETNQWAPAIYDGVTRVEPPHDPNYHFTTDMTNQAVAWMRFQQALTPEKPFYVYFATGATHAPHHAPKEYIAKYKGKFDQGWDKVREETLARQIALGVVPAGTQLTARPAEIPAWDTLTPDQKRLFARQMETFAGFAEHTDYEVGRLVQALEEMGEMENTLFFYIWGDNGASAEGGPEGTYNELLALNGIVSDLASQLPHIDEWGGPSTFPHFSVGWAHAGNTPFQWTKQVASHFGGTRNPMVVHWPARIQGAHGEVRSQFHHVIDVAPTVLEAAGLPEPTMVNGTKQYAMDGVSMMYTFDDAAAADRRTTQYFEMFGNRAIYHEGWVAATRHSIPWLMVPNLPPFDQDVWELYNVTEDFSQANDLAAENPEKLAELRAVFDQEAVRNHVYPLDDRRSERFDARIAGRPDLMGPRTSLSLYQGMTGISENAFINIKGRSSAITAEIEVPSGGANGVIIAQAGRFGGWSLYMKNGRVHHAYNFGGLKRFTVAAPAALAPGRHTILYEFAYDGGKPGSGGTSKLTIDGKPAGETRVENTMPFVYSADEGVDVGTDNETVVTDDYKQGANRFTGRIVKVTVEAR